MSAQRISAAILRLHPLAEFSIDGETLDGLQWHCQCPQPTRDQIESELAKDDEIEVAKAALRQSRKEKLIALGLTEDEIDA